MVSRPVNSVSNNPNNSQGNSQCKNSNNESISSFNPVEMSERWSDSYSFIENDPAPMSYCYQFLNDNNKSSNIPTQSSNTNTGIGTRKRGSMIDERLEKLQMERGMLNNSLYIIN